MAEKIPLEPIVSSNLKAIGYDPAAQVLAVQFLNGSIFHYAGVPLEVALEFGNAKSKGSFYASRIRKHFKADRETGPCKVCNHEGWVGDTCANCGRGQHVEAPRASFVTCPECHGTGSVAEMKACRPCGGSGVVKAK